MGKVSACLAVCLLSSSLVALTGRAIDAGESAKPADKAGPAADETMDENGGARGKPRKLGPRLDQAGVPSAVLLESGGLALSTNQPPALAVSESGVIYVFWPARGQKKDAVPSTELPMIPAKFSFGDMIPAKFPPHSYPGPEFSEVPGVNVCRRGVWSKPGVVVEGVKRCNPCFAWCAGEKLHLLVADLMTRHTQHFRFDPKSKQWDKLAELPFELTLYDAFRQVGETVHIGFEESSFEHTYACYLSFDGRRWSKPLRIQQSDNRSPRPTRVRLAVDTKGTAHLAWWAETHGYAMIRDGKAVYEPLNFAGAAIDREEFDLGIDPQGRAIVAYKADLPEKHPDARKIHVRRRKDGRWTDAEKIGGEGERLDGFVRVVWGAERTLVTWIAREEYRTDPAGGVLGADFRRFSIDDGKAWSPSRWIARYPELRGNGTPLSALDLGICIDKDGNVHICEETRCYCVVAKLGSANKAAAKP